MSRLIKDSITKSNELEKKENEEYEKEMLKFAREIFGEEYLDCLEVVKPRGLNIVGTDFELLYWDRDKSFFVTHPLVTGLSCGHRVRSLEDLGRAIEHAQKKIDDSKTKSKFHSIKKFLGIEK